jgi:hypothetical protein
MTLSLQSTSKFRSVEKVFLRRHLEIVTSEYFRKCYFTSETGVPSEAPG